MTTSSIPAINVHAHYGIYDRGSPDVSNDFMTGSGQVVADRAAKANIRLTIVSPLLACTARAWRRRAGNIEAAKVVKETPGLLQYVVIDPRVPETYRQAEEMLKTPKCVGIKIRIPEEHVYHINEFGKVMFEFAANTRPSSCRTAASRTVSPRTWWTGPTDFLR